MNRQLQLFGPSDLPDWWTSHDTAAIRAWNQLREESADVVNPDVFKAWFEQCSVWDEYWKSRIYVSVNSPTPSKVNEIA